MDFKTVKTKEYQWRQFVRLHEKKWGKKFQVVADQI